ncbi:MAG: DUF418 domain-containing protein, partial [Arenimonas sp.]
MNNAYVTAETPVTIIQKKLARIEVLDVLRGIALLGIFLMNIEYFNRPLQQFGDGIPASTKAIDYTIAWLTEIFVTGKFWVLFSLLFGMGFVVMRTQAQLDGRPFQALYLRRTIALLIFGLLHILALWSGDILHSYALVAFVLMWLPVMSTRASAMFGAGLYLLPASLLLISSTIMGPLPASDIEKYAAESIDNAAQALQAAKIYSSGAYGAVVQQRWLDFMHMLDYEFFVFISALGIFLIGASIMHSGRLLNLIANRNFFLKSLLVFGLLAACLIGLAQHYSGHKPMSPERMMNQALTTIGNLPLSLFYLSTIAYLMSFTFGSKILGVLAPAGKMALTNYLMQSLIGSLVFYGYGLGLW